MLLLLKTKYKMKLKIKSIVFVMLTNTLFSQQLEQSSLYMFNALYYNPAYAGSTNKLSSSFILRNQWIGFKGAPTSEFISIHSPIKNKKLGLGFHLNNDEIGSRKNFTAAFDLSSNIILNKNEDRLSVGISGGIYNYIMNFSNLYATDNNDNIVLTNYNEIKPNIGAGIYYYGTKHYLGLSIPTIIEHTYLNSKLNQKHILLTGGYVFKINSVINFKPSTIIKYTKGSPLSIDLNASFLMYKKLWIGGMYRYNSSVGINLAFNITNKLMIGYSYDIAVNKLRTNQFGSNEFMISYDFSKANKGIIYSPRYF